MEMRADGTCSILNNDCPETTLVDCKDCRLHQTVEEYKEKAEILQELRKEIMK